MLISRIVTALFLVAIVLGGVFSASPKVWQVGVYVAAFLALLEAVKLARVNQLVLQWFLAIVALLGLYWVAPFVTEMVYLVLTVVTLMAVFGIVIRYQITQAKQGVEGKTLILLLSFGLIALFTLALIELQQMLSAGLLLLSMAMVWAMDTGAYFFGRALGRRKLANFVSPGKSWEGVWGGALSALVLSLVGLHFLLADATLIERLILSLGLTLIALLSVFGDLFESVLKRQANLKDSGRILPGHGGILDRIDSLLVAMPLSLLLWMGFYYA
ncbi:phosphatidate cytidylyltransferase [Thiosulfatimonas sediminis]|uniref:Phosphatidate cytidylyltransferase n=1 Tax=Thiosulfatimonas sediminis TaxID=2675054 RepID=A0A6F8PV34_9GAMM|nr:phosphatidate cytidylyltransferase [Thiosulfatimonas sediminis]BBP45897.1 phosphatidate cytidylyltransferase [Thiosulfatimonas sediminis]